MGTENLIIVSGDSHATPSPDVWEDIVEPEYHYLLPQFHEDNETFVKFMGQFSKFPPELLEIIDTDGVWAAGG